MELEELMPMTTKPKKKLKRKSTAKKKKKRQSRVSASSSLRRSTNARGFSARPNSLTRPRLGATNDVDSTKSTPRRPPTSTEKNAKKSPGASPRTRKLAGRRNSSALERLTRVPKRNYAVGNLDVDMLGPLVDLAYWSTFLEVRRDAAAAFATLALNEANLEVLSQSGALGALLALIGVNNGKNDAQVHRDAASALSCLVKLDDVKYRLLKAPDGLSSIYYMCKSPSYEVKRAAVAIIANLCSLDDVKSEIVNSGGIRHLLSLTLAKDEIAQRKASRVLANLASCRENQSVIVNDAQALRCTQLLLSECAELAVRRDMIEMVSRLASCEEHNRAIVSANLIAPLLAHLNPRHSSLETISRVSKCLSAIAHSHSVHENMVQEGIVEAVDVIMFHELAEMRQYRDFQRRKERREADRLRRLSINPSENAKMAEHECGRKKYGSHEEELEAHTQRSCLAILLHLSENESCRQELVDRHAFKSIVSACLSKCIERKWLRTMLTIMANISDTGNIKGGSFRHEQLMEHGAFAPIHLSFSSVDYEMKRNAVKLMSHISASQEVGHSLAKSGMVKHACELVNTSDEELVGWTTNLLASLAEHESNIPSLLDAGIAGVLTLLLGPKVKDKSVKTNIVRAISMLSMSSNPELKVQLATSGALGYLVGIAKQHTGIIKMYASSALSNLEHDTAALRIQMRFRGFLVRNAQRRETEVEALREFMASSEGIRMESSRRR